LTRVSSRLTVPVFKEVKLTKKGKQAKIEEETDGIEKQLATICELKDELFKPLIHRIEILGSDLMDQAKEIETLKSETTKRDTSIKTLDEENKRLLDRVKADANYVDKVTNELKQYGRRNNTHISGINGDAHRQTSEATAELVRNTIKEKTGVDINEHEIRIAHRLGKFKQGTHGPIIVKFVRRQTKIRVFKHAKQLRQSSIYINGDLTKLNQEVLSSVRLKDKDTVKRAWSYEGKIFVVYNQDGDDDRPYELQYKQYQYWLDMPWTARKSATAALTSQPRCN